MEDGGWRMEDGGWRMEDGEPRTSVRGWGHASDRLERSGSQSADATNKSFNPGRQPPRRTVVRGWAHLGFSWFAYGRYQR